MPSFNPFGGVTGRTSATLFEIRLDNDIIVLRGGDNEASSQMLKGVVVLCLPSSLKCEDVHLRMTGTCKVGWNDQRLTPTGISNNRVDKTTEIFSHRWKPFVGGGGPGSSSRGTTLPAGNYEWPFELVIPGDMAESVEGLNDSHVIYKLKATVARGKLAYDLHAWKPVRIVRTLDPSALELAHAMTVENVWPNKIEYQLVIPQKAIIFGTAIEIQMRFTSLLKGLRIGQIKCILLEQQEFTIPGNASHGERTWKNSRDVETWTFELNEEEHYHDLLDDNGQDGYTLNEKMPLPKRLSRCLQDVDTNGIKVRHKVKFNVALHNPDGHVSELRATLPVTIFISPNMPLTSDGCLVDQTPMSTQSVDIASHAPPLYGEHVLDQLYADMDNSGFMTPAPQSGMNTPFYSQSRRGSHEDLSSLAGVANGGAVPPAALTSRLQNLNTGSRNSSFMRRHPGGSGDVTPAHAQPHSDRQSGYFDSHSLPHSTPLSRRTSEEDEANHSMPTSGLTSGRHSPEHDEYLALAELSKVPSYNTAVKTPLSRNASYIDPSLPNYEVASSRPASPVRSNSHPSTPGAELENGHRRNPLASMGFTPIHPPAPAHTTGHHTSHVLPQSSVEHRSRVQTLGDDDDERRLHLLRNRGTAH